MKAYVLKETTGRYRCHNVYVKDESYHRNITNASFYDDIKEAQHWAESTNKLCGKEFVKVVTINIEVEEE